LFAAPLLLLLLLLPQRHGACRTQEAALTGQIDAANAELANAQQAAKMKEQDLQQLERRRENLHQQVGEQAPAAL
jgi:hypothetical protein